MFVKELRYEQTLLQLNQKHHLEKLHALDNPSGILICQKRGNGFRWQKRVLQDGRPVTIDLSKSEIQLAGKLAVNLYRIRCIEYDQKQLTAINNLIMNLHSKEQLDELEQDITTNLSIHQLLYRVRNCPRTPADFFDNKSPYRPFIISYLEKEYAWIINWYLGDFRQNKDRPEHLLFPVKLGFNVRSKSEVMEADRMFEEGILFHYEELVLLSGEESYPDFVIPLTITEIYAWEHHGAMDKEGYFHRERGKILNYLDHQWFPGINMISTYETRQHPLTEEQVDHQIRWLKNRYRLSFPDLPPDESFNLYALAEHVRYSRIGE